MVIQRLLKQSIAKQWRTVVGVVLRLGRTSRGVRRGVSSRPQHPRVLRYSLHHHLWTMACSCKAWSRQCRLRPRLRRHYRLNCRHRLRLQLQFPGSMAMVVRPSWRDKKKAVVYQSPQRPAASSQQAAVPQSPSFQPSDKKMCPHCKRAHGGTECWKLAGKCLKCGSTEHQIRDCPRLQQFAQRGAPAPAAAAAAAPVIGRHERPRAQARVFALA
ncbi:hypothetical protein Taro_028380 [Colocasia esculenta]|uniref:CCHC-type domain-containing protein n=1 Tax=Colocasia esculenta TaxID=4460 RepID=A0A843VQ90_COLES|nr:hypothetical protein [Colocasia esculenta]